MKRAISASSTFSFFPDFVRALPDLSAIVLVLGIGLEALRRRRRASLVVQQLPSHWSCPSMAEARHGRRGASHRGWDAFCADSGASVPGSIPEPSRKIPGARSEAWTDVGGRPTTFQQWPQDAGRSGDVVLSGVRRWRALCIVANGDICR
jgi:hypothetical protein